MKKAPDEPLIIMHIVRHAEGGMRDHVLTLIRWLSGAQFGQVMIAPSKFIEEIPPKFRARLATIPLVINDNSGGIGSFGKLLTIARAIGMQNVDVVHCHGYKAAAIGVPAAKLAGKPAIITAHNLFPEKASGLSKRAMRLAAKWSKTVIAVSQAAKDSLIAAGVDANKITIIPNGVMLPQDISRLESVPEVDLPSNAKVVLCVARLTEVKGVRYLIEAAPKIIDKVPEAHILIAGDGPDRDELMKLAEQKAPGKITFLGYRLDVVDIMRYSDVVAMPSLAEGAPLALIEAMATAKPVVASDVGGISNMIRNETGVLVPSKDAGALAAGVVRVLSDPEFASWIGSNAHEYAQQEFDYNLMIERTAKVYEEVGRGS